MMFGMSYWWFAIPGLLLGLYAQFKLMAVYGKYSKVPSQSGVSGAQAALPIWTSFMIRALAGLQESAINPTLRTLFGNGSPPQPRFAGGARRAA